MKRFLTIIFLCALPAAGFAQEKKEESNLTASPAMSAIQTATSLAKYGYANFSASSLIEAAKILSETATQEFDGTKEEAPAQTVTEKDNPVSYDPKQLIADAKKYADNDEALLAYAEYVEKEIERSSSSRGAVGGPRYATERVYSKSKDTYSIKFWANELAEVVVSGDGDTDLDLYIYDENGNLIDSDTDYTDTCICRWVPSWTGAFTIRIVNRGSVYNDYVIATN